MIIIVSSEFQRFLAPLARCPLSSSLWDLADKDLNVKAETVLLYQTVANISVTVRKLIDEITRPVTVAL